MTPILVPVDGSETSMRALQFALRVTKEKAVETKLYVINVQPPILSGNVTRYISAETIRDYYNEEGEKALVDARAAIQQSGIDATVSVEVGPAAKTIAQFAEDKQCDSIIMGTRGLGGVSGLLLGSITTKVLHEVNIPVTVVK